MDRLAKINQSITSLYLKKEQLYLKAKPVLEDKEDAARLARYNLEGMESFVSRMEAEEGNQPDDAKYAEGTEARAAAERETERVSELKYQFIGQLDEESQRLNKNIKELQKRYSELSKQLFAQWLKPTARVAGDDEGDDEVNHEADHAIGQLANEKFFAFMRASLLTDKRSSREACSRFVQTYPLVQEQLLSLIKRSRDDNSLSIAAANAITVLNDAHRSFANTDFSHVNIAGADLAGAHLYRTSFKGADLSNVNLYGAAINQVDFQGAKLLGVKAGLCVSLTINKIATALSMSADDTLCAVGYRDGRIQLWNLQTLELVSEFKDDKGEIVYLAISVNAKKLLSYTRDQLCVWDVEAKTGIKQEFKHRYYRAFYLNDEGSRFASFSSSEWFSETKISRIKDDESLEVVDHAFPRVPPNVIIDKSVLRLLLSDRENALALWEDVCEIGKQVVREFEVEPEPGDSSEEPVIVFMSLDGAFTRLITVPEWKADYFTLWDLQTKQPLRIFECSQVRRRYLALSPNGQYVSGSARNHRIYLWNAQTGALQIGPALAEKSELKSSFSSNSKRILFPSAETLMTSWYFDDKNFGDTMPFSTLIVETNGRYLITADRHDSNVLRLWEASFGRLVGSFAEQAFPIAEVVISQDAKRIIIPDKDGGVHFWDMAKQQLLGYLSLGVPQVHFTIWGFALGPGDAQLMIGYYAFAFSWKNCSNYLCLVDVPSMSIVARQELGSKRYHGLYWLDHQRVLLYANVSLDKEIRVIDLESKESFVFDESDNMKKELAISDDRSLVAATMKKNQVAIWDTKTRALTLRLKKLASKVLLLLFSADSALLATASDDHKVRLWSMLKEHARSGWLSWSKKYGACLHTLTGHESKITALLISKASNYLISGDISGEVRVWDVRQGVCLQTFSDHVSKVMQIKHHANGHGFFTAGADAHMLSYALKDEPGVLAPATCLWSNAKTYQISQPVLEQINQQQAQASVSSV